MCLGRKDPDLELQSAPILFITGNFLLQYNFLRSSEPVGEEEDVSTLERHCNRWWQIEEEDDESRKKEENQILFGFPSIGALGFWQMLMIFRRLLQVLLR